MANNDISTTTTTKNNNNKTTHGMSGDGSKAGVMGSMVQAWRDGASLRHVCMHCSA